MLTRFEMPDARCPGKTTHPVHGEILGGNAEFSCRYCPGFVRSILKCSLSDFTIRAAPANAAVEADEPEEIQEVEELEPSKAEALKHIALSTQHLMHHVPKNPFCPTCLRAKAEEKSA